MKIILKIRVKVMIKFNGSKLIISVFTVYLNSFICISPILHLILFKNFLNWLVIFTKNPGGGNGNPLQYFCLGNPMDRGFWWAAVHGSQRIRHGWAHRHIHLKKKPESHYMMAHTLLRMKTFPFCNFSFSLNITTYHRKETTVYNYYN